jgi:hypothetical protein
LNLRLNRYERYVLPLNYKPFYICTDMRNISFKQIIILILIFFLLFGDFSNLKKKLTSSFKKINDFISKKNRKKRT